jgi:ribonuclease HI
MTAMLRVVLNLKPLTKHNAELFRIAMAIRYAVQRFGRGIQKIAVFTDSEAVLHQMKK